MELLYQPSATFLISRARFFSCSDPESEIPFSKALYSNMIFMEAFYNALSDDGILVMQLGASPEVWNADETHSKFRNRAATIKLLEKVGFESIHAYEEVSHSLEYRRCSPVPCSS